MDSPSVSSSANLIGIATGGTTVLGLAFYRSHLPKWKYHALEEVLKDTEETWATESHLLQNWELRDNIQERLISLRSEVFKHRERALGDITLRNQYKEFFKGLSIAMSRTYNKIECVRAQIITAAAREAERGGLQGSVQASDQIPLATIRSSGESHSRKTTESTTRVASVAPPAVGGTPPLHEDGLPNTPRQHANVPSNGSATDPDVRPAPTPSTEISGSSSLSNPTFLPNIFPNLTIRGSSNLKYAAVALNNYLQMRYHSTSKLTWDYSISGPEHAVIWTVIGYINNVEYGRGTANSKWAARNEAAREVLDRLMDPA
ncbi:hypothetical protein PILCRDRAFT_7832 [Piloderma croceum F 1598]|uniref:DRBM domain-containing protein n=1 Tax=Piloderma croceum (strain F 1598) TaxID=765440 RepID=A0A0C3FU62_PILCF|nr:hypothetical protein PILCRDRAFT_7832 [Piloderma croceum F 1598]